MHITPDAVARTGTAHASVTGLRRRSRIAALAAGLAGTMIFLSACAGETDSADTEEVTLTVWDFVYEGAMGPTLQELDAEFMEENPNVTIVHEAQPLPSYDQIRQSAVATREGPDVMLNFMSPQIFDYSQGLLRLGEYVDEDLRSQLTGWADGSTGLSEEGDPYAVPWLQSGLMLYYNRALFEAAGLDPDSPPATLEEWTAMCETFNEAGTVPLAGGFTDGAYVGWFLGYFLPSFLGEDEASAFIKGELPWTDERVVQSIQAFQTLWDSGCFAEDAVGLDLFPTAVNQFTNGEAAMFMTFLGASTINYKVFEDALGDDLGLALTPQLPGSINPDSYMVIWNVYGWSITDWAEHPDVAFEYIRHLTSADAQERLSEAVGVLPNHVDASPSLESPAGAQVAEWLKSVPVFTNVENKARASVVSTMTQVFSGVLAGDLSVEEALAQVQEAQEAADAAAPIPSE